MAIYFLFTAVLPPPSSPSCRRLIASVRLPTLSPLDHSNPPLSPSFSPSPALLPLLFIPASLFFHAITTGLLRLLLLFACWTGGSLHSFDPIHAVAFAWLISISVHFSSPASTLIHTSILLRPFEESLHLCVCVAWRFFGSFLVFSSCAARG